MGPAPDPDEEKAEWPQPLELQESSMAEARQLSLFKGKRQRGVRPPAALEFGVHASLADLLRRFCDRSWIWTHFPSGEEREAKIIGGKRVSFAGQRLKRLGLRPGFPDLQFFHIEGRCAFLEMKRRGNKPDAEQLVVLQHLALAGHAVFWTDSFEQAVEWLKMQGILPSAVRVQ
jgi:hypothetical protein